MKEENEQVDMTLYRGDIVATLIAASSDGEVRITPDKFANVRRFINSYVEQQTQKIYRELIDNAVSSGELSRINRAFGVATPIKDKKPKRWSRKGNCPFCGVGTGVDHKYNCQFDYTGSNKV